MDDNNNVDDDDDDDEEEDAVRMVGGVCEVPSPSTEADTCPPSPLGNMLTPLGKILELRRKGKLREGTVLVAVSGVTVVVVWWLVWLLVAAVLLVVAVVMVVVLWLWQMACRARAGDVAKSKSTYDDVNRPK